MKIFIVGLPQSGRTTVSKEICEDKNYQYIDAANWIRYTFREPREGEKPQHYDEEYHNYLINRLKINPQLCIDNIEQYIKSYNDKSIFVIDGIFNPKDFISLFDYNEDIVVFLNRSGSDPEYKDYENIAVSVIRDYCFWMSSAGLITKTRWLEYNFKIPGENVDTIKQLGSKNSVFIARSIEKVIPHLKEQIKCIANCLPNK